MPTSTWIMLTGLPAFLSGAAYLGGWHLALFCLGAVVVAKALIQFAKEK